MSFRISGAKRNRLPVLFVFSLFVSACGYRGEAAFPAELGGPLTALSREAASGVIDAAHPKRLDYTLENIFVPSPCSLEIRYTVSGASAALKEQYDVVLDLGDGGRWALPWDSSFLGIPANFSPAAESRYAVPFEGKSFSAFSVFLSDAEGSPVRRISRKGPAGTGPCFEIKRVRFIPRQFGFSLEEQGCFATPFVLREDEAAYTIEPPPRFRTGEDAVRVRGQDGRSALNLAAGDFSFGSAGNIDVPSAMSRAPSFTARGEGIREFILASSPPLPFPEPIPADPGIILEYPRSSWRDGRFEIFRWDRFPGVLIFDMADYAFQDRMLKRLAFFVEKTGFRGRLASDVEIADLHAWNAHDYRPEDLARFFDAARKKNFPLLPEERELEDLLIAFGIIRETEAGIVPGEGAIISISRESPDYLRRLFMVHEGFHGLFFIDEDFRNFSRSRWEGLSGTAKRFIKNYFEYQQYDPNDEYLMINEFMAYCLQQPVSQAGKYFGETAASRLDASPWRRSVLPAKDEEAGNWPEIAAAFTAEAEAFSAYVNRRWGLAAGRVRRINVSGN